MTFILPCFLLCLLARASGEGLDLNVTTAVIILQESHLASTLSFARWEDTAPRRLSAITVCYRLKMYYYRPEVTAFSYINTQNEKIRTDHNRHGVQVLLSAHSFRVQTDIITPLMHWSAFCFGLDATSASYVIYFNGRKWEANQGLSSESVVSAPDFVPRSQTLMDVDGTIVLGQDQDAPGDVFDATQSFSGEVADLNVWSRMLSNVEMEALTSCTSRESGDVLDWDTALWTLGADTAKVMMPLRKSCEVFPLPYFMFTDKLKFTDAAALCQAFGGELAVPMSADEQKEIYKLAVDNSGHCGRDGGALMWLGITDAREESVWETYKDKEEVAYFNWAQGQPNGDSIENCAVMKGATFQGAWADQTCRKSFKVCPMCNLNMPVFLRFRGICDANLYDDRFMLAGKRNNKPYFRGYYRSELFYSSEGRWKLENIMENNTHALMASDGSLSFPIGRHRWSFSHGFCGEQAGVAQSLTLTQCAKNEEFTCDDGTCIPINQVCDRRVQCPDLSDELDCSTVQLPKGYQSTLPPPSPNTSVPLPVYLNLTLSSFGNIDAINNRFTVELVVRMIWKDQRLLFKHLRRDRQLNIILPSEAQDIWVPIVDFLNAENNQHTTVDADCKITIKRLGNPLTDNIENSKEARLYQGNENYIRINRKYTITFRCSFNFFYFPFNTDYCTMVFRVNKNTENYVTLEKFGPGIRYEGKDQLAEYSIGGMYMERLTSDEPYSGLVTVITMQHLYATQLVTIFVPTTLINLISFATFYFKWFDFQNRIMVSLTALLVLSTLFAQISDNLPKTSYFKLIDIWFFCSILFSFVIIIIHTVVEFNHHYSSPHAPSAPLSSPTSASFRPPIKVQDLSKPPRTPPHPHRRAMLIDKYGSIFATCFYVIFFLVFWGIAFSQKISESSKVPVIEEEENVTGYPN